MRIVDPKPGHTDETRAISVLARALAFHDQIRLGQEMMTHGRLSSTVDLWIHGLLAWAVQLDGAGEGTTPRPYLYVLAQDQNGH